MSRIELKFVSFGYDFFGLSSVLYLSSGSTDLRFVRGAHMESPVLDLDELAGKCHSRSAKIFLSEAILCYKVGAYRAAISSVWLAIVSDFIEKLEELESSGDGLAKSKMEQFRKWRDANQMSKLLEFEREVLTSAYAEFQFISAQEVKDLSRIKEDRNRCVHPSVNMEDAPYSPSAESTRAHIGNAFRYFLRFPPKYGKSVLESLLEVFASKGFPKDDEAAVERLKSSALSHPREALLKDLVKHFLKNIFLDDPEHTDVWARRLDLVSKVQRKSVIKIIESDTGQIFQRAIDEGKLSRIFSLLARNPDLLSWIPTSVQSKVLSKLESVCRNQSKSQLFIVSLFSQSDMENVIRSEIGYLPIEVLTEIYREYKDNPILEKLIDLYLDSKSYGETRDRGHVLCEFVPELSKSQIERIARGLTQNQNIFGSTYYSTQLIKRIGNSGSLQLSDFRKIVNELNLVEILAAKDLEEILSNSKTG